MRVTFFEVSPNHRNNEMGQIFNCLAKTEASGWYGYLQWLLSILILVSLSIECIFKKEKKACSAPSIF